MKHNRYIITIALLLISWLLQAQPRLRTPEIYVGGQAGVMASSMIFNPTVEGIEIPNSPLSVNGGLVFRYAGHKVCGVQAEINYMQRGWREIGEGYDYSRQLSYIEIPFLTHLYFGGKHLRGFFNLGPQIGYCILDKEKGIKDPKQTHQYAKIDNPFDWGVAGGLGIYYRTNKIGLFQLEARFNYSFGNLFDNKKTDHFQMSTPINLSINLAYLREIKIK